MDFKNYSAKQIEKKYKLKRGEFHDIKGDILSDISSSIYKYKMFKVGKNPDIHLSSDGTIRIVSRINKSSFDTTLNFNDYLH